MAKRHFIFNGHLCSKDVGGHDTGAVAVEYESRNTERPGFASSRSGAQLVRASSRAPGARILIADHRLVRLGIRMALEAEEGFEVCAEAEDAESAILAATEDRPDVCLVGWDLPGGALNAIRGIFENAPGSAVVVLASTNDVDDLLAALRAGAIGYVPASLSFEALRRVVRAVLDHEAAIPRSMVREVVFELRTRGVRSQNLTSRESQVLGMVRRGQPTAEIARRLQISPVTVRRHVSELMHKLGVESRSELVASDLPEPADVTPEA
jgi:DNA-binding NarL/FixJ family response regulator